MPRALLPRIVQPRLLLPRLVLPRLVLPRAALLWRMVLGTSLLLVVGLRAVLPGKVRPRPALVLAVGLLALLQRSQRSTNQWCKALSRSLRRQSQWGSNLRSRTKKGRTGCSRAQCRGRRCPGVSGAQGVFARQSAVRSPFQVTPPALHLPGPCSPPSPDAPHRPPVLPWI